MFIWTVGDAIAIGLYALMALAMIAYVLCRIIRSALCKHDGGVWETMACDAVCNKCGVNLGFIGAWRERADRT